MGLGKTIMTIALLLAHSGRGGSSSSQPLAQPFTEGGEVNDTVQNSSNILKKATKFSGFDKLMKQRNSLTSGGSLIICPMTLLGQWKVSVIVLSIFTCILCSLVGYCIFYLKVGIMQ